MTMYRHLMWLCVIAKILWNSILSGKLHALFSIVYSAKLLSYITQKIYQI